MGLASGLTGNQPVVAVSLRYDRIDNFWHTLMHELGHVGNGDGLNKYPTLDIDLYTEDKDDDEKPQHEKKADMFAVETLVPQAMLQDFIIRNGPLYSRNRILGFATLHSVHPAIVLGQLQHRGELQYSQLRPLMEKVRYAVTQTALTDGWGSVLPAL